MIPELEIRYNEQPFEFREAKENEDNIGVLEGYAIVFNKRSHPIWGMFYEVVSSDLEVKSNDIQGLYAHDFRAILGRESAKTYEIEKREKGLWARYYLPDTTHGRDVQILAKRKDLKGQSFGFITRKAEMDYEPKGSKLPIRTLLSIELFETSVVADPAYPQNYCKDGAVFRIPFRISFRRTSQLRKTF